MVAGRGPGGGILVLDQSWPDLAATKEVQEALKLTDDQKDKIDEINDKMREEMREAFQGGFDREKMRDSYGRLQKKSTKCLMTAKRSG